MKHEEIDKAEEFVKWLKNQRSLVRSIDKMLSELKDDKAEIKIETRWENVGGSWISSDGSLKTVIIGVLERQREVYAKTIEDAQILYTKE